MADQFSLSVIFKVFDQATKPIKKIGKTIKQVNTPVKRLSNSFKNLGRSVTSSVGRIDKGMRRMRTALTGLPIAAKFAIPVMTAAIVKASIDFNKAMADVASLKIPLERIKQLKVGVRDLSIAMGRDTGDMAEGLYQVVSAFGDNAETLSRLKIVAKSATAGVASTTESLNLLSIITKEYGDRSAPALEKASDLAFTAVRLGQTTFGELAQTMSEVVPIAAQLKVSQEELFSVFATFTRGPGSAARVATSFNAALMAMVKPTDALKKRIKALGYESGSVMIKQLGFAESMDRILKSTKGSKEQMVELFGNIRAIKLIMRLAGPGLVDYKKKHAEMAQALGATNDAFKAQTEGINKTGFEWEQAMATMKVAAQELGDELAPAVKKVGDLLRGLAGMVRQFSKEIRIMTSDYLSFSEKVTALLSKERVEKALGIISQREKARKTIKPSSNEGWKKYLAEEGFTQVSGEGSGKYIIQRKENNQMDVNIKLITEKGLVGQVDEVKSNKKLKVKLKNETLLGPSFPGAFNPVYLGGE